MSGRAAPPRSSCRGSAPPRRAGMVPYRRGPSLGRLCLGGKPASSHDSRGMAPRYSSPQTCKQQRNKHPWEGQPDWWFYGRFCHFLKADAISMLRRAEGQAPRGQGWGYGRRFSLRLRLRGGQNPREVIRSGLVSRSKEGVCNLGGGDVGFEAKENVRFHFSSPRGSQIVL